MKAIHIISIILVVIAVLTTVLWYSAYSSKAELVRQNDSIRTSFESAVNTITDIQANIDSIESGFSAKLLSTMETQQADGDTRSNLITRLQNIKLKIDADKKRITDLEKQMAKSGSKIKGLETLVANLKTSLAEKEQFVTELSAQIGLYADSLSTERRVSMETIAKKDAQITEQDTLIKMQTKDLNTIFFAAGTRKELLDKKIIVRKGGILGIGRVSVIQKSNPELYEAVDLKDIDRITFPANKGGYSILTNQSDDSYTVVKEGDTFVMNITDKALFRQYKFLVIEIK